MTNRSYRPAFSVVIPTFNRVDFVKRAIKSVLSQTYHDFEIIVVDDCSEDQTENTIKKIVSTDKRVRYIRLEKNSGGAASRNRGVSYSLGEFIAFLDDDDESLPVWLEKSMEKIQYLPKSWGLLCPRWYQKSELSGVIYQDIISLNDGYVYEALMKGADLPIGTPGSVVKRVAFEDIGGFDESLFGFHDYDFFFSLSKKWTVHFLNFPLIYFHNHPNPRLSDTTYKRNRAFLRFMEKWKEEIVRIGGMKSYHRYLSKRAAGHYFSNIREEMINSGRLAALRLLWRSFSWQQFKPTYFAKNLLILVLGPLAWDRLRQWRGIIYWKLKRK